MADMYILTTRTRCAPVNIWETINYIRCKREGGGNTHVQVFCESPHKKRGKKIESLIELKKKKKKPTGICWRKNGYLREVARFVLGCSGA